MEANGNNLTAVINPQCERQFDNDANKVLGLIRRGKLKRALKMISDYRIGAFSIFNGVPIFGKTYDNIPFVAAALGLYSEKSKNVPSICEKIEKIINELFLPNQINSANMFDVKFHSQNGCEDLLDFILTHDRQLNRRKYDQQSDSSLFALLCSILQNGYTLTNNRGVVGFVLDNDLPMTLGLLIKTGFYKPDIQDMERHGLGRMTNVGRILSKFGMHKFEFREPEIYRDDKGKFCGGPLYDALKQVGYDISKPKKEFDVHLSVAWLLKDMIQDALLKYKSEGEVFSNETDLNMGDGSDFQTASDILRKTCGDYFRTIYSEGYRSFDDGKKLKLVSKFVGDAKDNIIILQNDLNRVLSSIGLPSVTLVIRQDVDSNDNKLVYSAANFMKELWDSAKVAKNPQM